MECVGVSGLKEKFVERFGRAVENDVVLEQAYKNTRVAIQEGESGIVVELRQDVDRESIKTRISWRNPIDILYDVVVDVAQECNRVASTDRLPTPPEDGVYKSRQYIPVRDTF